MFVTSLGVSWCYNLWLCSLDKAGVQQKILLGTILKLKGDAVKKYRLDNWPAMVVFVLLTIVLEDDEISKRGLLVETVLNALVEDTSEVWGIWKSVVVEQLLTLKYSGTPPSKADLDRVKNLLVSDRQTDGTLSGRDGLKLAALLGEARSGVERFKERARFA